LFTYPFLVDEGRLSEGATELKAALQEEPFVEVHSDDAEKRGISDGDRVRVTTGAGEAVVPAHVTPHIAAGSVFIPFNQPGLRANTLLSGRFTAAARLEAAASEAPAEEGVA
jgi:anaerobic selenocysteine-containing dehydrogenase